MERLYDQYGACLYQGSAKEIEDEIYEAFKKVWDIVDRDNICPRDAELLSHNVLSASFVKNLLVRAMEMKRIEREDSKGKR